MKKYKKLLLKKVNIASVNYIQSIKGGSNITCEFCDSKIEAQCTVIPLSIYETLCCDVRVDETAPEATCITIEDSCKTSTTRGCTL